MRHSATTGRLLSTIGSLRPAFVWFGVALVAVPALEATAQCSASGSNEVSIPIIEIGTFGGSASQAWAISPSGLIAGGSQVTGDLYRAFLFDGTLQNLGVLPGNAQSIARGINDQGQVVGNSFGGVVEQPFLWESQSGQLIDLDLLSANTSNAFAINGSRMIAGAWSSASNYLAGVNVGAGAGTTLFPTTNLCSAFYGINSNGVAVGDRWAGGSCTVGASEPFAWDGNQVTVFSKLADGHSIAVGLNAQGTVVGWSKNIVGERRAVRWTLGNPTSVMELGTLGGNESEANRVNGAGLIVGYAKNSAGNKRAFVYVNGAMTDLNDLLPAALGWTLQEATDINDDDVIVGIGRNPDGATRGFALNPLVVRSATTRYYCVGGEASLCVSAKGVRPMAYQWQGEVNQVPGLWIDIDDGPMAGVGEFAGVNTATLTITNATANAAGRYRCIVSNSCGTVQSVPMLLASCYANCDCSASLPALTANDFACFINAYANGQNYANCDGSTGTPLLTPNDFACFLNAYAAGCP